MYDILRSLFIDDLQSKPHYQHQNTTERNIQTDKKGTNTLLNRIRAPIYLWLSAIIYLCFVLNFIYKTVICPHKYSYRVNM